MRNLVIAAGVFALAIGYAGLTDSHKRGPRVTHRFKTHQVRRNALFV